MLPKTSAMPPFSMRIRVGSLIETVASTVTPSRASTNCSAYAGRLPGSASAASPAARLASRVWSHRESP